MYNVLIVDDEPRTIQALKKRVDWRRCGIRETYEAGSMEEALQVMAHSPVHILVCDIEMPGGTGLQLLEHLREAEKQINCIFITCHPEFDYMRKAIQLQSYDYILKPINYEEFMRVLTDLVCRMENAEAGNTQWGIANWGNVTDGAIRRMAEEDASRDIEMEVKKYIREHMLEDITIETMADALHFNPQYLTRSFKKKTGVPILSYMTNMRITTAKKILTDTKLPIREVAQMVGYGDYSYFTRVFKKETGISPSEYRDMND